MTCLNIFTFFLSFSPLLNAARVPVDRIYIGKGGKAAGGRRSWFESPAPVGC
jgi:hypothetical protein